MTIFVVCILLGLIWGTGTMLAPALPSREPRIASSGIFSLALVVSGAIFYGALFGWDTLVVDYLWFLLIIGIFLGGTLTYGMQRAEANVDAEKMEWPGVRLLAFFAAILVVMLLVYSQSSWHKADQQVFDKARFLQQETDLAALDVFPQSEPGLAILLAYLDKQLPSNLENIFTALLTVLSVTICWQIYDVIQEMGLKTKWVWGIVAGMAIFVVAVVRIVPDIVMWLSFTLSFWLFIIRYCRHQRFFDGFAAAVCGTAAILTIHGAVFILLAIYIIMRLLPKVLAMQQDGVAVYGMRWFRQGMVVGAMILIGIAPYLINR
jgi:hypothetical protein